MLFRLHHWSHALLARMQSAVPSSCALCGCHGDDAICAGCNVQFFARCGLRCSVCAIPLTSAHDSDARCGDCLKQAPAFDATIVAANYAAPVDHLVLALKFGGRLELAPLFARMMRDALLREKELALPSRLVAVPLGSRRLEERGFNQALEIAKPLSRALGIALDTRMLLRQRDTQAQALLHPDERHKNIRHAFIVTHEALDTVRGLHVGVVDDVMTTGETLNELAATLKRFGAARVTNFVFARTAPQ